MPSRLGVALILLFWLAVTTYVVRRDVLPRVLHDAPEVQIELADEATRTLPGLWGIYRNDKRIGSLVTKMYADDRDGTYTFHCEYQHLTLAQHGVTFTAHELKLATVLKRDGNLAGQWMRARLSIQVQGHRLDGTANLDAKVVNGVLEGRCVVKSPLVSFDNPLTPTPVTPGPVLHPMQPMNRLKNVRPGQRWAIRETNPLADSMALILSNLAKQFGAGSLVKINGHSDAEFIAEVLAEPVEIAVKTGPVKCWIIEYRSDHATARTWVAAADGKILRQEAASFGETLRLDRED